MNPVRAAVIGHTEDLGIGHAASADAISGLDNHKASLGGSDTTPGGDARSPCTNHDDVHIVGRGGARSTASGGHGGSGGGGKKQTAAQRHG
jgi:hypothetical protein